MRDGTATRARIDKTALSLFVKKGVSETTIRDIAGGAGIAEGTIYRHYESKESLVQSLFSKNYMGFAQTLEDLAGRETTFDAKVAAMIRGFCQFYDADWELFTFLLLTQHQALPNIGSRRGANPVEVIQNVIEEAQAKGEIPARDPQLATSLFLGVVLQPATFRVYGRIREPLSNLADDLTAAVRRVIGLPDEIPHAQSA